MSSIYLVNPLEFKDVPPFEVRNSEKVQIGTSFANAERIRHLYRLVQETTGEFLKEPPIIPIYATIDELRSSDKTYYSKWGIESQIEFFDTQTRFSFCAPLEILKCTKKKVQKQEENNFAKEMCSFWDSLLNEWTEVEELGLATMNWHGLKEAIFGFNRYMEPSGFMQGTLKLL